MPEPLTCLAVGYTRAVITAYIALGSNLGDRRGALAAALEGLARSHGITRVRASTFVETQAVLAPGDTMPQPSYLNAAAQLRTTLSAQALLQRLLALEAEQGRRRSTRWAARTVDLDLLLYGDEVLEAPGLSVPHPRFHARRFVLEPLAQLAPDVVHPVLGTTVRALLAGLDDAASPSAQKG